MLPAAVIFDLDGVLVDSEPLWHRAEIAAFGAVGIELTAADCLRTTGLRVDAVVDFWFAEVRTSSPAAAARAADRLVAEAVLADIVARVEHLLRAHGEPLPGAVEAVRHLADRGVPLAVASSSPTVLIVAALDRLGLADAFAVVRSAEHEPFGKPHPGVYLAAATALGIDPARCLAIEDSANGIRAAVAAGMTVIAVPDQPVAPAALALADRVLGSLRELPAWWDAVR
jgi:sugar-phosphatase